MANQFSFVKEQCWELDSMSIDKILSRYSTEHADTFRFLPPFIRNKKN